MSSKLEYQYALFLHEIVDYLQAKLYYCYCKKR